MQKKIKPPKKSTPIKNALIAVSLTSNLFMFALCYAVWSGEIRHADSVQPQQVALYGEDFITTLARR